MEMVVEDEDEDEAVDVDVAVVAEMVPTIIIQPDNGEMTIR